VGAALQLARATRQPASRLHPWPIQVRCSTPLQRTSNSALQFVEALKGSANGVLHWVGVAAWLADVGGKMSCCWRWSSRGVAMRIRNVRD